MYYLQPHGTLTSVTYYFPGHRYTHGCNNHIYPVGKNINLVVERNWKVTHCTSYEEIRKTKELSRQNFLETKIELKIIKFVNFKQLKYTPPTILQSQIKSNMFYLIHRIYWNYVSHNRVLYFSIVTPHQPYHRICTRRRVSHLEPDQFTFRSTNDQHGFWSVLC